MKKLNNSVYTNLKFYTVSDFNLFSQEEVNEVSEYILRLNDHQENSLRFTRAADKNNHHFLVWIMISEFLVCYIVKACKFMVCLFVNFNTDWLVHFNIYNLITYVRPPLWSSG
jgi:hypothetical protein